MPGASRHAAGLQSDWARHMIPQLSPSKIGFVLSHFQIDLLIPLDFLALFLKKICAQKRTVPARCTLLSARDLGQGGERCWPRLTGIPPATDR